jgi:hypothetical protein
MELSCAKGVELTCQLLLPIPAELHEYWAEAVEAYKPSVKVASTRASLEVEMRRNFVVSRLNMKARES